MHLHLWYLTGNRFLFFSWVISLCRRCGIKFLRQGLIFLSRQAHVNIEYQLASFFYHLKIIYIFKILKLHFFKKKVLWGKFPSSNLRKNHMELLNSSYLKMITLNYFLGSWVSCVHLILCLFKLSLSITIIWRVCVLNLALLYRAAFHSCIQLINSLVSWICTSLDEWFAVWKTRLSAF